MGPYADHAYYTKEYGGAMPEADYTRLASRASAYLDAVTFGRISPNLPDNLAAKVKDACCAVADVYNLNEHGGGVASENNDGVQVSYLAGAGKVKTDNERLYEAAFLYLGQTGLMFRGCEPCSCAIKP